MIVGIVGCGVLGSIQRDWLLKETEHEVLTYDIDDTKCNSSLESMAKHARFFILCLPTDTGKNGKLNMSIVEMVIDQIRELDDRDGPKSIVIRSTVPVGFTREMAKKYPEFKFYFMPEFLTEKTAREDFESLKEMIIGVRDIAKDIDAAEAFARMNFFPFQQKIRVLEYESAEMVKLATNTFYALKITFANELNDLCNKLCINYDVIKDVLADNPRIGSNEEDNQGKSVHLRIAQDGQPGYGGKCLPKDTKQLAKMMHEENAGFGLIEKVVEINNKIRHGGK